MDEEILQNEDAVLTDESLPANSEQEGGEAETNPLETQVEARIAELEGLRVETDRQLESLRVENAAQLAAYCNLARSLPGLVPELVGGTSLEAVQESVVTARDAYARIAANLTPITLPDESDKSAGPGPSAGGGVRSGAGPGDDQPAKLASERGVNLIYQALAGGSNGNLAR